MVYFNLKKFLYVCIENPKKTMNKLKRVFKPLKCYFRCSKKSWYPVLWCSQPAYIHIMMHDVGWKDKYDTPRYEVPPYIWIHLFGLNLIWFWCLPLHQGHKINEYWEQALWYLYYYDNISYGCYSPNLEEAKQSWPWEDYHTKKSSWTDEFLIK